MKDPSFTINSNGAVVALTSVSVAERGRTFFVCAQDNSRPESKMKVHLVRSTMPTKHVRQLHIVSSLYSSESTMRFFLTYPDLLECHSNEAKDS